MGSKTASRLKCKVPAKGTDHKNKSEILPLSWTRAPDSNTPIKHDTVHSFDIVKRVQRSDVSPAAEYPQLWSQSAEQDSYLSSNICPKELIFSHYTTP